MQIGRSSTGKSERGKGLQNFVMFAQVHESGILSIYSGKGMYRMTWSSGGKPEQTEKRNLDHSIGGTLIEWSVQLAKK